MDDLDGLEAARLINLTSGALVTQVISAAAALGVADALVGASGTSAEVGEHCGAHPTSVRRLLGALAALGIVEALDDDLFCLSDMGHLLRDDIPGRYGPGL